MGCFSKDSIFFWLFVLFLIWDEGAAADNKTRRFVFHFGSSLLAPDRPLNTGSVMTALNSYTDELKSLWTDAKRKTEPYAEEAEQVYSWFGLDARMEIGTLNRRFYEMLDAMRSLCTSRTLSNWIEETLVNNPFVIPAANGANGHGVRRLQALPFGVLFCTLWHRRKTTQE